MAPHENRLMLIGIPLFMYAHYMGNQLYRQPFTWTLAQHIGVTLLMVCLLWLVIRQVWSYCLDRLPSYRQTLPRVGFTVLFCGLAGMVVNTLLFDLPAALLQSSPLRVGTFAAHFGPMFFFSALVTAAHEVVHNFHQLRRLDREKEELKKAHLQSQLDSLKSQVNPHFLFNSLNTLASLIGAAPDRAEHFVEELASVYRYLLQSNEHQLATLRQELDFAQSYFHLLKTRFGSGIELFLSVEQQWLDYNLPSLALQLLLENAVKHNVITPEQPLKISIFTLVEREDEPGRVQLVVQNNLQRKQQAVASSRMGLSNIIAKLQLLGQPEVHITETKEQFTVSLPLFLLPATR